MGTKTQINCGANQLIGFYMMATFTVNELKYLFVFRALRW